MIKTSNKISYREKIKEYEKNMKKNKKTTI